MRIFNSTVILAFACSWDLAQACMDKKHLHKAIIRACSMPNKPDSSGTSARPIRHSPRQFPPCCKGRNCTIEELRQFCRNHNV